MGVHEGKEGQSRHTAGKLGIVHNSLACGPNVTRVRCQQLPWACRGQISTRDSPMDAGMAGCAEQPYTGVSGFVLFDLLLGVIPHRSVRLTLLIF